MEKGYMKKIDVVSNPDESMDIEVNDVPVVRLSRMEVEELYFLMGAAMMDQDLASSFVGG